MTSLPDVEATLAWGRAFARKLHAGSAVALVGNLGAGKTHAAKGIAQGLGITADVSSPTFTLVHEYEGGQWPVFHFDFYRLDSEAEVIGIGWDDYVEAGGIIIVEWADRFPNLMPTDTRWFQFETMEDGSRSVEEIQWCGEAALAPIQD